MTAKIKICGILSHIDPHAVGISFPLVKLWFSSLVFYRLCYNMQGVVWVTVRLDN